MSRLRTLNGIELTRQSAQAVPLPAPAPGLPGGVGEAAPLVLRRPRPTRLQALLEGRGARFVGPVADLTGLVAAVLITFRWPNEPISLAAAWPLLLFPPLVMLLLLMRGMYERRLRPTVLDGAVPVAGSISVATMTVVVAEVYLVDAQFVPAVAAHLWTSAVALVGLGRVGLIAAQRSARARGLIGRPTLIIGAGQVGVRIARRLDDQREYGLRPVGFLDADPLPAGKDEAVDIPVLGSPDDLDWVAQLTGAEHVVVAFSSEPDERLVDLVRRAEALGLEVSLVPRLFESLNHRAAYEPLGGTPLVSLRTIHPKGWQFAVKHVLDRVAAAALLIVFTPLMLLAGAAVWLSSPGRVLFRQRRVGRDGTVFDLVKFRTMAVGDGAPRFRPAGGSAPGGVEGEDRRTRLGRMLRRTSLDELPQLLNVLKGEMSLVGPRPERPEFVELFETDIKRYGDRHRVKSGITGWAQVHGLRGQTSLADRVEWDNYYIEHWSLGLDLKILALTVIAVFRAAE
jgi:exopolysaccharide biosynthesis polyprenyl glycosylphosphotransferase